MLDIGCSGRPQRTAKVAKFGQVPVSPETGKVRSSTNLAAERAVLAVVKKSFGVWVHLKHAKRASFLKFISGSRLIFTDLTYNFVPP